MKAKPYSKHSYSCPSCSYIVAPEQLACPRCWNDLLWTWKSCYTKIIIPDDKNDLAIKGLSQLISDKVESATDRMRESITTELFREYKKTGGIMKITGSIKAAILISIALLTHRFWRIMKKVIGKGG